MTDYHIPVMLDKCMELMDIDPNGVYVDLTFGGGGHSKKILSLLGDKGRLFSFDQDKDAKNNIIDDPRFTFVESNFRFLRGALRLRGITQVDGILADLGVSSHHFDTEERGFSFRFDAPLDMRMNQRGGLTAAKLINTYSNEQLTQIFRDWGEISTPYKVANCIERFRSNEPIETIFQLVEAVKPCTPKKDENKFLSKLFQAIRIEVNREMEALKMALDQSTKVLKTDGRLVVMSYHSLEDRLVKNFMRSGNIEGKIEKDFFGKVISPYELVTRKALVADEQELILNSRSRSAKLRASKKV